MVFCAEETEAVAPTSGSPRPCRCSALTEWPVSRVARQAGSGLRVLGVARLHYVAGELDVLLVRVGPDIGDHCADFFFDSGLPAGVEGILVPVFLFGLAAAFDVIHALHDQQATDADPVDRSWTFAVLRRCLSCEQAEHAAHNCRNWVEFHSHSRPYTSVPGKASVHIWCQPLCPPEFFPRCLSPNPGAGAMPGPLRPAGQH